MTDRMTMMEFLDQCDGVVNAYRLNPGQTYPQNYGELVDFILDRLDISEGDMSVSGLSEWLLNNRTNPNSCSPEIDAEHVEAILLIGELPDPDAYLATLPNPTEAVVLPPPQLVRLLLAEKAQ